MSRTRQILWGLALVLLVIAVAQAVTTSSEPKPTCEEALQIEDCASADVHADAFELWGDNLQAYIDSGALLDAGMSVRNVDYAYVGLGICHTANVGNDFGFWYDSTREHPVLEGLDAQAAADLWNRTIQVLCPELKESEVPDTTLPVFG